MNEYIHAPVLGESIQLLDGRVWQVHHPKNYFPNESYWRVAACRHGAPVATDRLLIKRAAGKWPWEQIESTPDGWPKG